MDSMRSLDKSLPTSPKRKQKSIQPPEQLLQAFKTAALSVTNLYKTAATDQSQTRRVGYQNALDDILTFLDRENLGLGDGEGWRVRQWATERLDGSPPAHGGSESDEERVEIEKPARSSSPTIRHEPSHEVLAVRAPSRSTSPTRIELVPSVPPIATQQPTSVLTRPEVFTFRSTIPYPQDIDMQTSDTPSSGVSQLESQLQAPTPASNAAVRLEVVPRGSRPSSRHINHSSKHNTRSTASVQSLGAGAGSKRRLTYKDFFDLGSLGDGKEGLGGGGGKRGRFN
ncbi:hypothetical protein MMC12_004368 [Toensbergia leucococca]|nr:hypothetical protein [Toensbergia leucococca]